MTAVTQTRDNDHAAASHDGTEQNAMSFAMESRPRVRRCLDARRLHEENSRDSFLRS